MNIFSGYSVSDTAVAYNDVCAKQTPSRWARFDVYSSSAKF